MKLQIYILLALILLGLQSHARAGTTGKITGQVTDENDEPLPGASVIIEGTRRGNETDEGGIYFLLSIEPGHHTLTAHMVGFESQQQIDVRVSSDFTTNVNFTLKESALQLQEIVVEAKETSTQLGMLAVTAALPPVEPDKTISKYMVRANDIETLPTLRNMAEFIELQAGVSIDEEGEELTVRAGDVKDVGYYLDGIPIHVNDHADADVYRDINRLAVQEMTIITGGMDAEYGNAQGGIVSMVTREGKNTYHGLLDYQITPAGKKHWGENVYDSNIHRGNNRWDDPQWAAERVALPDGSVVQAHKRLDYTSILGHYLEGSIQGPVTNDMTFFFSSRWQKKARAFPGPHLSTPFNTSNVLKVSYTPSRNLKVIAGGLYDRRKEAYDPIRSPSLSRSNGQRGEFLNLANNGQNVFLSNPNPAGDLFDTDYMVYAGITHLLSKRTFYDIRISRSLSTRDTVDTRLPPDLNHISEAFSGDPILDKDKYYAVYRDFVAFERFRRNRLILKADLSSQVTRRHFVKTGLEFTRYNNWFQAYSSDGPTGRRVAWYGKAFDDTDFFPGRENKGVTPLQFGMYAQDKIELEGMVINAGLRYDLLLPNTEVNDVHHYAGAPMYVFMTRARNMPGVKASKIASFTHRIGVSHPLTSNSVIRYYYGRLTQFPNFAHLFINAWSNSSAHGYSKSVGRDLDLNENGVLDPAEYWNRFDNTFFNQQHGTNLLPEETSAFEVGVDYNFINDYVISLTTYYKSSHNQVGRGGITWIGPINDAGQAREFRASGLRDTRGFEISLKRRFSMMFAFNLALNMQWADQSASNKGRRDTYPDSLFVANGHYWNTFDTDPTTGAEIPVSLREQAVREGKAPDHYIILYGDRANSAIRKKNLEVSAPARAESFWTDHTGYHAAEGVELASGQTDLSFYDSNDRKYWERLNSQPNYPGSGEGNLMILHQQLREERQRLATKDRHTFGSMTFLLSTPPEYGPWHGKAVGGLRANLVYRFYSGTPIQYTRTVFDPKANSGRRTLPAQDTSGPMHSRADLNVEKVFGNSAKTHVILAVEVFNLFNQKDLRPKPRRRYFGTAEDAIDFKANNWVKWGIERFEPTSRDFIKFGEINDLGNYWDSPREMTFSVRIKW